MPRNNDKDIRCSFCGKHSGEVERMIAGPGVYICNECIELCNDVLNDEPPMPRSERHSHSSSRKSASAPQQEIPKPAEIKKVLDDYVIGQERAKKILSVATVLMFALLGSIFLLRHQLVRIFDFGPEALEAAAYYTGFSALLSIFSLYSFSFVPMSAFRAAGDIRYAVTVSVSSMFALRVALCYVLNALFPTLGLMCVYIGMGADWALRSVLNIRRFRSGKWLHRRVI